MSFSSPILFAVWIENSDTFSSSSIAIWWLELVSGLRSSAGRVGMRNSYNDDDDSCHDRSFLGAGCVQEESDH